VPDVEGLDGFGGPVMHTSRWDDDVPLGGTRVGVVGTGASAAQVIPRLAERASELVVFQRTPTWVVPRGNVATAYGLMPRLFNASSNPE